MVAGMRRPLKVTQPRQSRVKPHNADAHKGRWAACGAITSKAAHSSSKVSALSRGSVPRPRQKRAIMA